MFGVIGTVLLNPLLIMKILTFKIYIYIYILNPIIFLRGACCEYVKVHNIYSMRGMLKVDIFVFSSTKAYTSNTNNRQPQNKTKYFFF